MKKSFYLSIGIIVLFWFPCNTVNALKYKHKTEVLVLFMPDSLELQSIENIERGFQPLIVKSSSLSSDLAKIKVKGITKAFPSWVNKDSIVTRFDGLQVKTPPFHRIFSLTFHSEAEADSAIIILKKSASVIFVEKHSEPTLDNDLFYMSGYLW